MRVAKAFAIVLVVTVGIAGCASRRCCRCSCHQATQQDAAATADDPVIPQPVFEHVPIPIASPAVRSVNETPKIDNSPSFKFAKTSNKSKGASDNTNKLTENDSMYGHADDYSWLKGRLQKVHVPGVEWKIRYLPIDKADQWGGSMVLAPDIRLEDYKDGDVVYVEGKQLTKRPSLYVTGPLYRIDTIRPNGPIAQATERQ